jgi:DNA invertase Pin-like site-specific DNA recombinase
MSSRVAVPKFKSEREEAQWWDAHPEVITPLFLKAKKEGRIERLPRIPGATKSVTIRLPIADLETTQEIADKRGLPYQTFIKGLPHQALERESKTR